MMRAKEQGMQAKGKQPAYVGIDGGGTKTRALVTTAAGEVLADLTTEGSNVNHFGWAHLFEVLGRLFAEIRATVPDCYDVAGVCLGMAGVDREEERKRLQAWSQTWWNDVPVRVVHDALIALVAGCGQSAGIVLIAGTGSIAFGQNEQGMRARVGGWGYLLGDEGSGYDLGRQALTAVLRAFDGRGQATKLTELVLDTYGLTSAEGLIPLVYDPAFTREKMGGAARQVLTAAAEGDEVSVSLLEVAAKALAELVDTLLQKVTFERLPVKVALTGGLFHAGSPLIERVKARLPLQVVDVVTSELPPVYGAVRLAMQHEGMAEK